YTSMADNRRLALYTIGMLAVDAAEGASGGDKTEFLNDARSSFDALSKDPGTKYADQARTGMARVALVAGDTAALKASYADQLANPAAFSYNSLMMAAVTAAK